MCACVLCSCLCHLCDLVAGGVCGLLNLWGCLLSAGGELEGGAGLSPAVLPLLPPPWQPILVLSQPEQLGLCYSLLPGPLDHLWPLSFCLGHGTKAFFSPGSQNVGRLKSKACLWLPAAGSFSSAGEQGLVVLIIGFLSASGPGALSKSLAAAGRMAGGCPGVGGSW